MILIIVIIIATNLGHLKVTCFGLSLQVTFFQMGFQFFLSDGIFDLILGICGVFFSKRAENNHFFPRSVFSFSSSKIS
jgi:hypothetical protein